MKKNQLIQGKLRKDMYIENKGSEINGVKGRDRHWAKPVAIEIDGDALEECMRIKTGKESVKPKPPLSHSAF
jgi:hypothetical protein